MNLVIKQKQTHRECNYGYQAEKTGEGIVKEFGWTCTHCYILNG